MTTKLVGLLVVLASTGSALADLAPPPPPPPPPPPAQETIPPKKLEELRTAGSNQIEPDDATKKQIVKDKKDKVVTSWKVCITTKGEIASANLLKTSGYADYDTKIDTTIRKTWKFKPYTVDGTAKAACTAATFIWAST